jgi:hypothetical protein
LEEVHRKHLAISPNLILRSGVSKEAPEGTGDALVPGLVQDLETDLKVLLRMRAHGVFAYSIFRRIGYLSA